MKKNDLEYNMCQEYTPIPDEYLQKAENIDVDNHKNGKIIPKKMMYMFVTFSALVYMVLVPGNSVTPVWSNNNSSDVGEVQEEETGDKTTPVQEETTEKEQPGNIELSALPVYPVEDNTSYMVVYNDSYDADNDWTIKSLSQSFIFDSTIANGTEYPMPEYEPQEGFKFLGWVVYYDKDYEKGPSLGLLGDELDFYDLSHIKPKEDGSRSIEIHAAWRYDGIRDWPYLLTLDSNGGTIEDKSSMTYDAVTPLYSASYVYLCAYPVPVREGYTFAGWYDNPDCQGKQITVLYGASFFEVNEEDGDGNGFIDWNAGKTITLYAGWVKSNE